MKLHRIFLAVMVMTVSAANAMLPTPSDAQLPNAQVSQVNPEIDAKLHAFLVRTDAAGKETLQPLTTNDNVVHGDVIEYQGLYTNHNANRLRSMTITLSIPKEAELIGMVEPAIVRASVDGQRFVNMPIRTRVNGQIQEVPLSYYKALRWTIEDVGIGATAAVKYRVRIK
ncbi:hypothetical protein M2R47_07780 [Moraxella sp. Tifton1]|uniref:DUF11 domain-containing protein n=1 Tax=Moraxella oculi TaxID=2940516 RepID=A0ABW8UAQ4_9GAMM|nr:hypothetical protein [Moraxella sp. Tifton1]MCL1624137.1 hypothetical protein [Moraxella sp. Tifton1]